MGKYQASITVLPRAIDISQGCQIDQNGHKGMQIVYAGLLGLSLLVTIEGFQGSPTNFRERIGLLAGAIGIPETISVLALLLEDRTFDQEMKKTRKAIGFLVALTIGLIAPAIANFCIVVVTIMA